jgi:hypothetical protein
LYGFGGGIVAGGGHILDEHVVGNRIQHNEHSAHRKENKFHKGLKQT